MRRLYRELRRGQTLSKHFVAKLELWSSFWCGLRTIAGEIREEKISTNKIKYKTHRVIRKSGGLALYELYIMIELVNKENATF